MPRALKSIRWTIDLAASEFGIDRKTLAKRIKAKSILAGDDKKFSTTDICRAIYTSAVESRTELNVSQKENYDLKNKKLAGKLADVELFQQLSDNMVLILRQKISDYAIPEALKSEILKDLQKINVDEVVAANSKTDSSDLEEQS